MNKMILVAAMTLISMGALADEVKQAAPQAHVALSISMLSGDSSKVSPRDYPNGIYVVAKKAWFDYPVIASIWTEKMRAKGFKIAEKAEDADAVFRVSSTMDFGSIEKDKDSISGDKAEHVAATVIGAVATGGLSLLATDWSFLGRVTTQSESFVVKILPNDKAKPNTEHNMQVAVKSDANNVQVQRTILDLMASAWFNTYLAENKSPEAAAQSAVVSSTTIAEALPTKK